MGDRFELSINSYGTVQGFVHPGTGVAEVRGLPYATVPGRFRSPIVCQTLHGKVHDGTEFGYVTDDNSRLTSRSPSCPQIIDEDGIWVEETFPRYASQPRALSWDDLRCTNLNITFPTFVFEKKHRELPVMVYIHGKKIAFNKQGQSAYKF